MSYTYLQGQEVVSSEVYCWDTDPCALLSSINMPEIALLQGRGMDCCHSSQCGTMSVPSMENPGGEKLISCAGDSPVKISAPQEKAPDLMESAAGYGGRWQELYMKFDRNTSSLKTHLCLWEEDLPLSSVTLPGWGMMQDGVFLERTTLGGITFANVAGFWPTPLKEEGPGGSHKKLTDAVAIREGYRPRYYKEAGTEDKEVFIGKVNPEWAEWLMGWPMGWTDASQELEMGKFQSWLQQHFAF